MFEILKRPRLWALMSVLLAGWVFPADAVTLYVVDKNGKYIGQYDETGAVTSRTLRLPADGAGCRQIFHTHVYNQVSYYVRFCVSVGKVYGSSPTYWDQPSCQGTPYMGRFPLTNQIVQSGVDTGGTVWLSIPETAYPYASRSVINTAGVCARLRRVETRQSIRAYPWFNYPQEWAPPFRLQRAAPANFNSPAFSK